MYRDRVGGDEGGQGVATDELQQHRAGSGGADPAQQGAEPVRQVLRVFGEVGRGLAGDQADRHPVGVPGGGDLAEHGQQDAALVLRGQVGDRHDTGPPAPVEPGPPLPAGRGFHPAGERGRPEPPPGRQDHHHPGGQADKAEPAEVDPGDREQGQDAGGQRMPGDQPDQPGQQPEQFHGQDDPERSAVDRGAPHRERERVRVIDLGHLLARHDLAHSLVTSFVHTGENPGAAGGTSSSRPASITPAITPPAREPHRDRPGSRGRRPRTSPARSRTGSRPRRAGEPRSRRRR